MAANSAGGRSQAAAAHIDNYLRSKGSPLAGQGKNFWKYGNKYNVSPYFLVAIAGGETSFGKYGPSQKIHNPFGMGPGIVYPSWEASIEAAAKNLATNPAYKNANTPATIGPIWAPVGAKNDPTNLNKNWTSTIPKFLAEMVKGADANTKVKGHDAFIAEPDLVTGVVTAPVEAGAAVVDAAGDMAGMVGKLINAIMDWKFWARVGMVVGGAGLIFFGLRMFFREKLPGADTMKKITPIGRVSSKAKTVRKKDAAKSVGKGVATEVVENAGS